MPETTDNAATGQVNADAARIYDAFFVPALFAEWASPICDAAEIRPGDRVIDIACGTGVAAREAAKRSGGRGNVTGIDRNSGMLMVAQEQAPHIDWRDGRAEALHFDSGSFDVALCQFGLMFFEDRALALREMRRVIGSGGRAVVAVWDRVENSPGYAAMIDLIDRMFGHAAANALRAPFALGELGELNSLFQQAGWNDAAINTRIGKARFDSITEWVSMDVRGWTLADMIDNDQYDALVRAANEELVRFTGSDGTVTFAAPGHIIKLHRN
ncbi:MAG TPA: methyltransferase domain-containing protein [Aestuariivirga sp.]